MRLVGVWFGLNLDSFFRTLNSCGWRWVVAIMNLDFVGQNFFKNE
jgi:hypothetical protein